MMPTAVIFDMDGLIIDSEPFWQAAEVDILGALGVPITLEATKATVGMRLDNVIQYWFTRHPWEGPKPDQVVAEVQARVIEQIETEGAALTGFYALLDVLIAANIPTIIASSSHSDIIDTVIKKLNLVGKLDNYVSAFGLQYGKPHPEVFIRAAERLGIRPQDCLVLEDSVAGCIAAKAAQMQCFAVPAVEDRNRPEYAIADGVFNDLSQVCEALALN